MFVLIPTGGTPQVFSADDLGSLSVRGDSDTVDRDAISRALHAAAAGEVVDDHVWLDTGWLHAAAGRSDRQWQDGFAAMLEYAAAHGWLSADGRRVRAHIESGTGL